jgi:hypothetical protein
MSDDAQVPHLRILPAATEATTPDESVPETPAIEVDDTEPDTGKFLEDVLEKRRFPPGAVVGDGTPGPGRKPYDIDERIVRAMALAGGTNGEIAEFCGCSRTVIEKRFGEILVEARSGRKLRLRQKQYQMAMEGNVTMLIWLGKQELGQYDESRIRVGDLNRYSDEELAMLAQGKVPGQIGAGKGDNDVNKEEKD